MKRMVRDLKPDDMVDLEGDKYADPKHDPDSEFIYEYQIVDCLDWETPNCICVYFFGCAVGFPPDHKIEVATP